MLSALDVHTARWVAEKCLSGHLLHGRTVILITHNLALTGKLAQNVVEVGSDGHITQRATVAEVLEDNPEMGAEFAADKEAIEIADGSVELPKKEIKKDVNANVGKLIAEEEIAIGHVSSTSSESDPISNQSSPCLSDYSGSVAPFPKHGGRALLVFAVDIPHWESIFHRVGSLRLFALAERNLQC